MVPFNTLTSIGIWVKPTRLVLCSIKFSCDCLDCILLTPRILRYLNTLDDEAQHPAARCVVGENIYMCRCSALSAVEGMNAAIKQLQTRTVDLLNATLLLIKMECKQIVKQKQQAWGGDSMLTPCEHEEYDSTFKNLHSSMYNFVCTDCDHSWVCCVQRTVRGSAPQTVTFPKLLVNGSYFGTCTCEANKTGVAPCNHMAAVALSMAISLQITPVNIMPIWWKRTQWRSQLPSDVYAEANLTIQAIKTGEFPMLDYVFVPIGLQQKSRVSKEGGAVQIRTGKGYSKAWWKEGNGNQ